MRSSNRERDGEQDKVSIWEKVDKMVAQGKAPVLKLNPSTEIVKPKRPRGRPRIRLNKKRDHYVMHTPKGWALRCRNPGCRNRLKAKESAICCSLACEHQLREMCETYLSILNGDRSPTELPTYMRTYKLRHRAT